MKLYLNLTTTTAILFVVALIMNLVMFNNYRELALNDTKNKIKTTQTIASTYEKQKEIKPEVKTPKPEPKQVKTEIKKTNNNTIIGRYTDLKRNKNLTSKDVNSVIEKWDKHVPGGTPFRGKGEAFIAASNSTGLDPLYLLALAAWESGWGKSTLAKNKNNFYGIAAYDHNPNNAYAIGKNIDEGIINGAKWIKKNYYDEGHKTLDSMIYGGKMYSSSKEKWIAGVSSIMIKSHNMVSKI